MNRRRALALVAAYLLLKKKNQRQPRRFWVHPLFQKHKVFGEYYVTFLPMKKNYGEAAYAEKFYEYLRMDLHTFQILVRLVSAG